MAVVESSAGSSDLRLGDCLRLQQHQPAHYVALIPAEATGRERVMSGVPAGRYTIGFVPNAAEPKGKSAASAALLHNPKK